jgi:hypothetical protein
MRADWATTAVRARQLSTGALIVDGLGIAADELVDAAIDRLPSEVAHALLRIAPDFDIGTIASYPPAALAGLSNAVKGALFELRVAEALQSGHIDLPDGVTAFHLVGDFSNPGYDAELLDAHGHVVNVVQLKTSQTADLISKHLNAHPDIPHVWSSHEAATDAAHRGMSHVFDTHISDHHLNSLVAGALTDQATTSFGEVFNEVVPQVTYGIIAIQAAWRLMQGEPPAEVLAWAARRAGTATAISAIAGIASLTTGTDLVRVPVVLGVTVLRVAYYEVDGSARRVQLLGEIAGQLDGVRKTVGLAG